MRRPQPVVKAGRNGGRFIDPSDPDVLLLVRMQELSFFAQTGATRRATWGTLAGARMFGFERWDMRKTLGALYIGGEMVIS